MYYGNMGASDQSDAEGVWESDYKGVWHLAHDGVATTSYPDFLDSTSNNNDGSSGPDMDSDDLVEGQFDGALDFDGDDDGVNVGDDSSLEVQTHTISMWVNRDNLGVQRLLYGRADDILVAGYEWGTRTTGDGQVFSFAYHNGAAAQGWYSDTTNLGSGFWIYLVGIFDGTDAHFYINGDDYYSIVDVTDGTINHATDDALIADQPQNNEWYGIMDEVRITSVARSSQWIATEYNNQRAVGEFISFTAEERTNVITKINTSLTNKLTDGLVGHWTFDGQDVDWSTNTAYDRSGQGNDGEITNMNTSTAAIRGKVGQALDFDGTDDYVNVSHNSSLEGMSELTVSLWINKVESSSSKGMLQKTSSYRIDTGGCNDIGMYVWNSTGTPLRIPASWGCNTFADGWHHYAFIVDSLTGQRYIDGVASGAERPLELDSIQEVGAALTFPYSSFLKGTMDEVRIYNRALSADEMGELYRAGSKKLITNAPLTNKLAGGLIGHWSLNGQDIDWSTNTVYDRSVTGKNGTITNMSTSTSPIRGKVGQALNFDGTDDCVRFAKFKPDVDNKIRTNGLTLEAWYKGTDTTSKGGIAIQGYGNHTWSGYGLFLVSGKVRFNAICIPGAAYCDTDSTTSVNDGEWHHLVGVISSTTDEVLIYVDGVQEDSGAWIDSAQLEFGNSYNDFTIGCKMQSVGPTSYLEGIVDEVRIYDQILSADAIQSLYRAGARKFVR